MEIEMENSQANLIQRTNNFSLTNLKARFTTNFEKCLCVFSSLTACLAFILFISLVIIANSKPPSIVKETRNVCTNEICQNTSRDFFSYMDLTVNPCEDMYEFACKKWKNYNPIPETSIENDRIFQGTLRVTNHIRVLLDNAINPERSTALEKAIKFYKSCANYTEREQQDPSGLPEVLSSHGIYFPLVENVVKEKPILKGMDSIIRLMNQFGVPGRIVSISAKTDDNPKIKSLIVVNPSITGDYSSELRVDYRNLMVYILKKIRVDATDAQIDSILDFEEQLKKIQESSNLTPERVTLNTLKNSQSLKAFVWPQIFRDFIDKGKILPTLSPILFTSQDFFSQVGDLIEKDRNVALNYLGWKTILYFSTFMTTDLRNEVFKFQNKTFQVPHQVSLGLECADRTNNLFPFAIGKIFYEDVKSIEHEAGVQVIMDYIRKAFISRLERNSWIDKKTKNLIIEKTRKMTIDYFYPRNMTSRLPYMIIDQFYSGIEIPRISERPSKELQFVQWMFSVNQFHHQIVIDEIGRDSQEYLWERPPAGLTPFYVPTWNLIAIPTASMFDPFYVHGRPQAVNFGSLGFILSHELIHAFDSQSRVFGKFGDRQDLWSDSAKNEFDRRAKCLVEEYNNFEVDGQKVNGQRTLLENLADSEGLRLAFDAFRLYAQRNPTVVNQRLSHEMRGFSPDQLFFISFSNTWCSEVRNQKLALMMSDSYAPKKYRVLGSLRNSLFGEVFKCQSATLQPPEEDLCHIW